MGSNSRYGWVRPMADTEEREARALHAVAGLLADRSDLVPDNAVRGALANVLDACAVELGNGRPVTREVRRAIRGLANHLQRAMRHDSG